MKNECKNSDLIKNYSNLDLQILSDRLRKNGFDYFLIERNNEKCIYKQTKDGIIYAYEVFKNKIIDCRSSLKSLYERRGKEFNENNYKQFKEKFPADEEFGKRAWSCTTLERAKEVYNQLQ